MTLAFWASLLLMALHEVDAVRRHEWRILPGFSFLPEETGRNIFLWSHVPLAGLAIWLIVLGPQSIAALCFSGFAIAHSGLHWLFRNHPKNEFGNLVSWAFITGAGMAGFVHLWLAL